jgi:tryptophan 2,3-dioxygenase
MAAAPDEVAEDILYYWDYLHLDALLSAQTPKSAERGGLVHDEIFFITVHQTYELWFKQILVELDSVMTIMSEETVAERELRTVLARLQRINEIQRLMVAQMGVLETLTPLDFLDFRALLLPASGFQSVQFRLIENKFGLLERDRVKVEGHNYAATLRGDHAALVSMSERAPSLFDYVERWLARAPFLHADEFDSSPATARQPRKCTRPDGPRSRGIRTWTRKPGTRSWRRSSGASVSSKPCSTGRPGRRTCGRAHGASPTKPSRRPSS